MISKFKKTPIGICGSFYLQLSSVIYAEHKQEPGTNAKFYPRERRIKRLRNKWWQNTRKLGRANIGEKRRS